jgi:hypothetical protein
LLVNGEEITHDIEISDIFSTMSLVGRPYLALFNPLDSVDALRPLEITDDELEAYVLDPNSPWHGDTMSYIPGLNYLSDLFTIWYQSQNEHPITLSRLQNYIQQINSALDHLPSELRWRGGLSRPPKSNFATDVQTVNLYITQVHIRSNLLEQLGKLATEENADKIIAEVAKERQRGIDDMLAIVYQVPQETLEANGSSLVRKLRDIGLALLHEDTDASNALVNLDRLLAKLDRLDFRPGPMTDQTSPLSSVTGEIN